MAETNFCQTKKKRRGRPAKKGASVRVTVRFREGEHDEILERLKKLPEGGRSAYIRRVLAGAPVEALDAAMVEDQEMTDGLDSMWELDEGV